MSAVSFLCDEMLAHSLRECLLQEEPALPIIYVGEEGAPRKGTPDPQLLREAEAAKWSLVTFDRSTMPHHADEHMKAGNHTFGIFVVRSGFPLRICAEDLLLIWACSEAEEWSDRVIYLPWVHTRISHRG
jgi:hypothetical protein